MRVMPADDTAYPYSHDGAATCRISLVGRYARPNSRLIEREKDVSPKFASWRTPEIGVDSEHEGLQFSNAESGDSGPDERKSGTRSVSYSELACACGEDVSLAVRIGS